MTKSTARPINPAQLPPGKGSARKPEGIDFPIVGVGASAGGLEAFSKLLDVMPANSGMALVLIQHLDPKHESLMVNLLAAHTSMTVLQVTDNTKVERDHVYLIPPARYLAIDKGVLRLSTPPDRHGARLPFDFFLRSLARDCARRAVCVVLSGTGTDGSLGLQAVKEGGGLVIAQEPSEAASAGMPRSAIAGGRVDFVLPVGRIAETIIEYSQQNRAGVERAEASAVTAADEVLTEVIGLLATSTSHNFSAYKRGTLQRRIERRMVIAGLEDSEAYLGFLRREPVERELLTKDLLINVTRFFRDPSAFSELEKSIIPELVQRQTLDRPLRVWVPGCSTGEEAYSIAMLFLEQIALARRSIKLQVFASDIDPDCVSVARNGYYPESVEVDITPERLERFFTREAHHYQVVRELRETVVFTVHSVLADAPFSRLDLVSCRNLLIYLSPETQQEVLSLFHFALREGGVLFLGSAETAGDTSQRFVAVSKKHRIYRQVRRSRVREVQFPFRQAGAPDTAARGSPAPYVRRRQSIGDLAQRAILDAYAPTSVLINAKQECLFHFGATDRYLKIVAGESTRDIIAMARDGVRIKLRSAIHRAKNTEDPVTLNGAHVDSGGVRIGVRITIRRVEGDGEVLFLVSFLDEPARVEPPSPEIESRVDAPRTLQLEKELEATRQDLQSAIADLEMANEEQKAVNEEAMSVNEEFQSTNEELETSKEELQSLNEELSALNSQLHETVELQRSTSSDLQNILNSTDMATLFLDADLKIRFFTPAAKSLFNVIDTDIGRRLSDLTRRFHDDALLTDAQAVLATNEAIRLEVRAEDGGWHMRGIFPYRSDELRTGVVITFSSISEIKAAEQEIEAARTYLDNIIATIRQPLVVLDDELRVISISRSFHRVFSVQSEDLVGKPLLSAAAHLNVPALREFLASIDATGNTVIDHEVEIEVPGLGKRMFQMSAKALREAPTAVRKILIAIVDVTEAKREGQALEAAKFEAERANAGKSRFLAAASHDLRQPLQTISLLQGLLERTAHDEATQKLVRRLDETVATMSSMLNKLLDINQLEAGVVRPSISDFPVQRLLDELRTEFSYYAESNSLDFRVLPCELLVRSDPRLLEQIVRNLLTNAVKYTRSGRVLVGCRRHGDWLRIEVWDTGHGIPETELRLIFEEFHQLDNPARQRSKGLGLGLAIVQRLADLLGHRINVQSRVGAGSVFSIEVPVARAGAAHEPTASRYEPSVAAPHSGVILIVDDDPSVREMLDLLLIAEGYTTIVAADGELALELTSKAPVGPDLVICDYNLPNGPNGLDTIAKLQALSAREIPAIVLTGDISTSSLKDIAGRRCAHLSKPVKAAELMRSVERLLAKSPTETPLTEPASAASAEVERPSQTVFVVDDDAAVRDAMSDFLRECGYAVEQYADGATFIEALGPGRPGCLLVDAVMPGLSGIDVIEHLKASAILLPTIVITGNGAVSIAVQAMKAGAVDFIEKPVHHEELLAAIARAFDQSQGAASSTGIRTIAVTRMTSLTVRQRQILALVLAGHPSKNIAADLGISQRTVDNHRAAIMRKTGSRSIPALIRTALAAA